MKPLQIALFQGHKPALLYKLAPEELTGYDSRVAEYVPEWKRREDEKEADAAKTPPPPSAPPPEPVRDEPPPVQETVNPAQDLEYTIKDTPKPSGSVGMMNSMKKRTARWDGNPGGPLIYSASFGQFLMHSRHRIHSVPFFRLLELSVTSTSIGHTFLHLPQDTHLLLSHSIRSNEK